MDKKILAIIPARAGSKRVLKKNFRSFAGSTLTDLAISQALESNLINKIAVSSDSKEIKRITSKYSDVDFIERPEELASDVSPAVDYMIHVINHYKNETFDLIVIIQPSSPLRNGLDIDNTINLLLKSYDSDSSVSIVKLDHMIHPYKLKTLSNNILKNWLFDEKQKTAEHELPNLYVRNGAVYVFKLKNVLNKITLGEKSLGYLMPFEKSVDINSELDFKFAEFLFESEANK